MEELKFQLVVFHPYRPMQIYINGAVCVCVWVCVGVGVY